MRGLYSVIWRKGSRRPHEQVAKVMSHAFFMYVLYHIADMYNIVK